MPRYSNPTTSRYARMDLESVWGVVSGAMTTTVGNAGPWRSSSYAAFDQRPAAKTARVASWLRSIRRPSIDSSLSPSRMPARYPGPPGATIQSSTPSGESSHETPSVGGWYRPCCSKFTIPNTSSVKLSTASRTVVNRAASVVVTRGNPRDKSLSRQKRAHRMPQRDSRPGYISLSHHYIQEQFELGTRLLPNLEYGL